VSKGQNRRKAVQNMTCRSVVSKYLDGTDLESCLMDLRAAMRSGPQAWAFKPQGAEELVDDRIYYNNEHEGKA